MINSVEVVFLSEGNYDHYPALLCVYPEINSKRPFRFHNMRCAHPSLISTVREEWHNPIDGCPMYRVHMKLKLVKNALRESGVWRCRG